MVRPGLPVQPVDRRRKSAPLRPFLQCALGIALRGAGLIETRGEAFAHKALCRREARIKENCAEDSLADVAEDGGLLCAARLRFAAAKDDEGRNAPFRRDLRAGFAPNEFRQAA